MKCEYCNEKLETVSTLGTTVYFRCPKCKRVFSWRATRGLVYRENFAGCQVPN